MNEQTRALFMQQMKYQLPLVVICAGAIVLALIIICRHPGAGTLTLLGAICMIATSIGNAFLIATGAHRRVEENWPMERYADYLSNVAYLTGAGRAVAFALIVTAVFIGRSTTRSNRALTPTVD